MYLDIHSHILHGIDDGAEDLSVSLALLEKSYAQGVTDIIATPHFYPLEDNLDDFLENRSRSMSELQSFAKSKNIPNIHLGCEVLYYSGISRVSSLDALTLNGSKYILLEPDYCLLTNQFLLEILYLRRRGYIPIIAHIERYQKVKGYRKFLKFLKENGILTQVNATSFFGKHYTRILKKLVKENLITIIASDAHSLDVRPPMIEDALKKIETLYGTAYKNKLVSNSQKLFSQIIGKNTQL